MGSSSLTPVSWAFEGLSTERPRAEEETKEETELERRVWPLAEKRETVGDTGAEELTVRGD